MRIEVRLIIAGSRGVSPTPAQIDPYVQALLESVRKLHPDAEVVLVEVISGAAYGVDKAGEAWAIAAGVPVHRDPVTEADYAQHGRYHAPKMRNRRMAERGTHALIFWDGMSGGSADMCTRMVVRKKPVETIPWRKRHSPRGHRSEKKSA